MKNINRYFLVAALGAALAFFAAAPQPTSAQVVPAAKKVARVTKKGVKKGAHYTKKRVVKSYKGGRWVTIKTYKGGKWVTKKVWRGGKRVIVGKKKRKM
ncbi:MAG: hypothetical protein UZ17_ACD001001855 [Acidobacteria bacterium OLB17]|nr:MAG: hypothetical protein UZ17_ACD001001855 [Acidobacteria bacterium OLB17]MCZ2391971.1 hypothetical protein [Acidobacteriota bacterium]